MIYEEELSKQIIGIAIEVHKTLGHGFLEKIYENAMCYEFRQTKINYEQQKELDVFYKNEIMGKYITDILVDNKIILELKANKAIEVSHMSQLMHYLKATNLKIGYIINFGSINKLEFKRCIL